MDAVLEANGAIVHIYNVFFGSWNLPEHQTDRTQGIQDAIRAK